MIIFTAGGAIYEAFAAKYPCQRISIREEGVLQLAGRLKEGDVLIHNAASLSPADLSAAIRDNFILTRDLVDSLQAAGVKIPLLFISSMSMLGKGGLYKDPLDMNPYSFSKYIAELYCLKSAIPTSCIRFSTLFYKDPIRDGLSKMIKEAVATREIQLINGGKDTRDFIPLTIAVEYLYKITRCDSRAPIYNIASGNSISFAETAMMVKESIKDVRISSLEKPPASQFILSEFEKEGIRSLGELPMDLKESIHQYIGELI